MRALISGAGVAGPVLAHWLHRSGWEVTVAEQAADPRAGDGGHAVDLFGPAVDVIDRMGLYERVHAARTRNDTVTLLRPGRAPVVLPTADVAAGFTDRHIEVMRGALAGMLHDASRDHADYRFGTVVEQWDGGSALLSDGTSVDADVLIGADGLHSGVRALVFGPESRFRRFLGGYLGVYSLPDVLGTGATVAAFAAPNVLAAVYPTLVPGRCRAVLLVRTPREIAVDRRDPAAQRAALRGLVGDTLDTRADAVLAHLDTADDLYFDDISQIWMDSWSSGRATLVGDAGYGPGPAVGGGTSLAAVGAYLLAAELAEAGRDGVPDALRRYEAALADPVRHSRRVGPSMLNSLVPRNRAQVWLTAQAMRLIPRLPVPVRRRLTSFGGGPAAMLDGLTLPAEP
ncbi:FAD-dependent monooxygenase [Actinoplanes utahensis]|uniref:FAD-binding domain-containing protein n=1 Tax=Actinoplanes utahensis TaxID=1869 RepID=A0A0A6UKE9_ACTUT|nr:FAD-dependent monooxygenase [Actinoplanes utahensis]KHD75553.1 hypothetical protein MB27_22305 [Actinoplanes utahensis]GIF32355.1 FAD-dependent oxidoreductase [Actinoplanes utahensis]